MEEINGVILSPNCKTCSVVLNSPGNNPFDELWKNTKDTTMSEQINRRSSIGLPSDFFEIGRRSLSFRDFDGGDFGKESMGILPPDFGRDSLGFMNLSNTVIGRESLGILQINALRDSLSFRRESLGILNLTDFRRESLDLGRESLGILNMKSPDLNFIDEDKKLPDILLTTINDSNDHPGDTLNTALLYLHSRKCSSASSTTSVNPSFNSRSLEGPSRIYSLSSMKSFEDTNKSDIFNKAFCNTFEYSNSTYSNSHVVSSIHSPFNKGRLFSPGELHNSPTRIKSLPITLEEDFEALNDKADFKSIVGRQFWTTDRTTRTKTLDRKSFHGILDFNEGETSNDFQDSVFIEGYHIAEKIADGSILNDSTGGEIGILDCTPQPDWPDEINENEDKEKEDLKCNTEIIFKNVDKLLPPPVTDTNNLKFKTSKTESNLSSENGDKINKSEGNNSQSSEKSVSKLIHNISEIAHESNKLSVSRKSQSKSKDAKEILHNLSEILNCTNRSDQQKYEGQNLLSSLANMLSENKSNTKDSSLDDSGHSSIHEQPESPNKEKHESFEVLDLRTKTASEDIHKEFVSDKNKILDLSSKHIKNIADGCLTQSFSSSIPNIKSIPLIIIKRKNTSTSGLDFNRDKSTVSNNSSVYSNDSRNSANLSKSLIAGSLRQKTTSYGTKKGPMKAVIPIGDMRKKNNIAVTPEKTQQKMPSIMQSSRTSTPINYNKNKFCSLVLVIGLQNITLPNVCSNLDKDRANTSTTLPRSSVKMESSRLVRRNSASEVKKTIENVGKLKRCNSIEKETGIMSSLAKVRQNIVNSPYYQSKKQNALKENNSFIGVASSKEKIGINKSLPDRKPAQMISKLRSLKEETSTGKELGIMSSLPKIRHNILNSPYYMSNKENIPNENNNYIRAQGNEETLERNKELSVEKLT
ncbi:hypothetical protein NQ314_002850 [Rhamnusium bicolor]|uniref:Uncharacterized protein n=1 Tax=Rhamnusium bicolor TaxID=1586634 RepID=A0AAV8ZQ94_9CUCU|nr:hypothetical protein NQ314_002850 [Rhamnusium bicolor]